MAEPMDVVQPSSSSTDERKAKFVIKKWYVNAC